MGFANLNSFPAYVEHASVKNRLGLLLFCMIIFLFEHSLAQIVVCVICLCMLQALKWMVIRADTMEI